MNFSASVDGGGKIGGEGGEENLVRIGRTLSRSACGRERSEKRKTGHRSSPDGISKSSRKKKEHPQESLFISLPREGIKIIPVISISKV